MSKMAIAYKMMKKKKMADGGVADSDGIVKKSDSGSDSHEYTKAASDISNSVSPQNAKSFANAFKAKGGEIKGVNKQAYDYDRPKNKGEKSLAGESMAGSHVRDAENYAENHGDKAQSQNKYKAILGKAKDEHHKTLGELKTMAPPNIKGLADGGPVNDEHDNDDLVMKIMKKRYSEGGKVANDTGEGEVADEMPNQFDDLVLRDDLESSFDGENSGDHLGNAEQDEERHDIVSRIMKSQKKKDKLPQTR